jgi:flagellin
MALGVLNNISAIYAQNNLNNTQESLSTTLQQLSSGSRINSGADDAAGLSLANGLQASSTALMQSAANASEGVDFLQVADGALSQVTSLLNRAVTLATEASNGTLNSSQVTAADSEYQKILTETDTINNNTEYNGINTFAKNSAFTASSASDNVNIGQGATGTNTAAISYNGKTLVLENSTTGANASSTAPIAANGTGYYKITAGTDTLSSVSSAINELLGANISTVQGEQLVLSGGAAFTSTAQQAATTMTTETHTMTVQNANDIISPGANAIKWGATTAEVALTGAFGANGSGGTLAQLAAAINTANGGTTIATLNAAGTVMTVATDFVVQAAGTWTDTGTSNLTDTLGIPLAGSTGASSLKVGNASDTLTVNTGALQFTTTGGSAVNITNFTAGSTGNLNQLAAQINTQFGSTGAVATVSGNTMNITGGTLSQASGSTTESEVANAKTNQTVAIFTSDGTISQSYNNSASDLVQASASALSLAGTALTSTAAAEAALTAIDAAITSVAADRGTLGANINTLTAVENVMHTQSTNTLSAENDVTATDYGTATSNMSKFQILMQTGIAALSQANQTQQLITKLLQ